jgi:anti-sigma regulatory factor (Ser/Thr protein kinase)
MARLSATGDDRSGPPPGGDADLVFEMHDMAQFDELIRAVTSLLERTPLTARQVKDFRQAVVEMAGNALKWGREKGQAPWALVTCQVGPQDVTVIVRDRGPGFVHSPPVRIRSADDAKDSWKLDQQELGRGGSGFGIMLARALSDVLSYNDLGNEVTLVKRFGPDSGS